VTDFVKGIEAIFEAIEKVKKFDQCFADEILKRVKEKTPVATGRLQNAWQAEINQSNHEIRVFNDAENDRGEPYAIYVEYGTIHMPGAFMLTRTQQEAEDIVQVAKKNAGL